MENEKKAWQTPELQEMAVVVLSLHQKWWQKMAAGEKVLELRKSKYHQSRQTCRIKRQRNCRLF